MKTITIITPSNIDVEYQLAGLGSRFSALIIDMLLQLFTTLLCAGILFSINHQLTNAGRERHGSTIFALLIVLVFIIYFGYFIVCEMTMNGQTIGKKLFRLRTIRDNGQPIEFTQALIRGIIRSTLDIMYLGMLSILFSKKHKRLGDMAAGTIVIIEKYNSEFEQALSIQDIPLPESLPPLDDMPPKEREIVENWLRRKHILPNDGMDIGMKISDYYIKKAAQPPSFSDRDSEVADTIS